MASSRHALPLLLLFAALVGYATAAAAEFASLHGRMAAEWAWSAAASSTDDDSCWGSPQECPVFYHEDANGDDGAGAGATARARMRLQEAYYDVNTAASLLPTAQFISYSTLMRDTVPCSIPGASYYNCQPGAEANPYSRGCSEITQCRG